MGNNLFLAKEHVLWIDILRFFLLIKWMIDSYDSHWIVCEVFVVDGVVVSSASS